MKQDSKENHIKTFKVKLLRKKRTTYFLLLMEAVKQRNGRVVIAVSAHNSTKRWKL